jgi:desulfoferrodoxin-like iron-binding protein
MVAINDVREIYRFEICGNVVEVIEAGGGELACCDEPMALEDEEEA